MDHSAALLPNSRILVQYVYDANVLLLILYLTPCTNLNIIYIQDGESGWSSLHRALHFGHLAVASILLQSGASTTLEDCKSRTPVDLLSGPVLQVIRDGYNSGKLHLFQAWLMRVLLFLQILFHFVCG